MRQLSLWPEQPERPHVFAWELLDDGHHYYLRDGSPVGAVWTDWPETALRGYRWQCADRRGVTRSLVEARVWVEHTWTERGAEWERPPE